MRFRMGPQKGYQMVKPETNNEVGRDKELDAAWGGVRYTVSELENVAWWAVTRGESLSGKEFSDKVVDRISGILAVLEQSLIMGQRAEYASVEGMSILYEATAIADVRDALERERREEGMVLEQDLFKAKLGR